MHNGRGIGSCARPIKTAYFVDWSHDRAGYSLWPNSTRNMTRFLFYVEHGPEEGIACGRLLANPPVAALFEEEVA